MTPDPTGWPLSGQYHQNMFEGLGKAPPSFGSPTLVWSIGVWLARTPGRTPGRDEQKAPERDGVRSIAAALENSQEKYAEDMAAFVEEINGLLRRLQERGRQSALPVETFSLAAASRDFPIEARHVFDVVWPQSIGFTLWWRDEAEGETLNTRQETPSERDLRVRVLARNFGDFVTISFYIDASKPFNGDIMDIAQEMMVGRRRTRIAEHIQTIRRLSGDQIRFGHVQWGFTPERGVSSGDAAKLQAASEDLYEDLWDEFQRAFGVQLPKTRNGSDPIGEVFANARGLVFAVKGFVTEGDETRKAATRKIIMANRYDAHAGPSEADADPFRGESEHDPYDPIYDTPHVGSAYTGFGAFDTFDFESGEPNTVLKSMWPFTRRVFPWADHRGCVGCGIISKRALLVTAIDSALSIYARDEAVSRAAEAPGGSFNPIEMDRDPSVVTPRPLRYMILTKGQPHQQQIGRFVQRVNDVTVLRLFALKNFAMIRNAGTNLRLIGRELDGVLIRWSNRRNDIERRLSSAIISTRRGRIFTWRELRRVDQRIFELSDLINTTQRDLIMLNQELDQIGDYGASRLLYSINRSLQYVSEFERLRKTLEIDNVDGWTNYDQFVDRSITPLFGMIRFSGDRLHAIRERLQSVSETIQTSALIVETEATRANTSQLRNMTFWLYFTSFSIIGGILLAVLEFLDAVEPLKTLLNLVE